MRGVAPREASISSTCRSRTIRWIEMPISVLFFAPLCVVINIMMAKFPAVLSPRRHVQGK